MSSHHDRCRYRGADRHERPSAAGYDCSRTSPSTIRERQSRVVLADEFPDRSGGGASSIGRQSGLTLVCSRGDRVDFICIRHGGAVAVYLAAQTAKAFRNPANNFGGVSFFWAFSPGHQPGHGSGSLPYGSDHNGTTASRRLRFPVSGPLSPCGPADPGRKTRPRGLRGDFGPIREKAASADGLCGPEKGGVRGRYRPQAVAQPPLAVRGGTGMSRQRSGPSSRSRLRSGSLGLSLACSKRASCSVRSLRISLASLSIPNDESSVTLFSNSDHS